MKGPADSVYGETHFLVHNGTFSPMSSDGRRGKRALWCFLSKGTNPIHEGSILMTYDLPKAPPPNTITLGIRFQHMNFWGDTNIQSIASTVLTISTLLCKRALGFFSSCKTVTPNHQTVAPCFLPSLALGIPILRPVSETLIISRPHISGIIYIHLFVVSLFHLA